MSNHSGASENTFNVTAESESGLSFHNDTEPEQGTGAAELVPAHLRHVTAALSHGPTYGKAPKLSAELRTPSPLGKPTQVTPTPTVGILQHISKGLGLGCRDILALAASA